MTLIRRLSALVAGFTLCATPALARIDKGTTPLLQSLPSYGIDVRLNPPDCALKPFHGYYDSSTRVLAVCYRGRPKADDHDTVRHEAFHAIQHCAGMKAGYNGRIQPILTGQAFRSFVLNSLPPQKIVEIKSNYPRDRWNVEMEAFAAASVYSADQIFKLVHQWCPYG